MTIREWLDPKLDVEIPINPWAALCAVLLLVLITVVMSANFD